MVSPMSHKFTQDVVVRYLKGLGNGKSGLWTPKDDPNPNPRFAEFVTRPNRAYEEKPLTIDDVRLAIDKLYKDATTSWTPEERLRGMSKPVRDALLPLFDDLKASKWTPEAFRREYLGEFIEDSPDED